MCAGGEAENGATAITSSLCLWHSTASISGYRSWSLFLRTDVGIEQLVYALTIDDQIGTVVTAVVILYQTVSIIFDSLECLSHLHTEVGHER